MPGDPNANFLAVINAASAGETVNVRIEADGTFTFLGNGQVCVMSCAWQYRFHGVGVLTLGMAAHHAQEAAWLLTDYGDAYLTYLTDYWKWLGTCLRPTALTRRGGHWTFATPSSRQTDGPACIYKYI